MKRTIRQSIIFALLVILVAQASFSPILLNLLFVIALIVFYSQKVQPKHLKLINLCFVLASLAVIYLSYKTLIGIEAGVAVLATFLFAKTLESKTKRDVIIVLNFALFVSASTFLYSQAIWVAILVLLSFICCLVGLYRLQTEEFLSHVHVKNEQLSDIKHVTKFVAYAVPFFVLLFLFFPRLPPLWHVPIPENQATTGISDQMSPGDIAKLSQSSALAFRILGDMKQLPPRSELYWRAMVLDQYDGQTWTSNFSNQQPNLNLPRLVNQQVRFDYQYLAADAKTKWVMNLEKSIPLQDKYILQMDWGVVPARQSTRIQPIAMRWLGDDVLMLQEQKVSSWSMQNNLRSPHNFDLKSQQLAQQLYQESGQNPARYIERVLQWYRNNQFVYTLEPGLLGQNKMDEFLFQSRQGFCEHYASSFVMLMRYVGIPARVVVGYQGGQLAPDGQSWEVRQLDAHAWTEVFLEGRWVRYDPTAIIAPNRIESGMQNLISNNQQIFGQGNSIWQYQQFNFLNKARIWSDYFSYQWQAKVVGYDVQTQKNWFNRLGFQSAYTAVVVLVLSIITLILVYLLYIAYTHFKKRDRIEYQILKLSKMLPTNLQKQSYEPTIVWFKRVSNLLPQNENIDVQQTIQLYEKIKFSGLRNKEDEEKMLKLIDKCAIVFKKNIKHLSSK